MNIYLFIIVAGTTIIGWIWFFYENRGYFKSDELKVTLYDDYEYHQRKAFINDFWTNSGIFKSEHKNRTVYLITKSELNELNSLYAHEVGINNLNRKHFESIFTSNNSTFERIVKQVRNR